MNTEAILGIAGGIISLFGYIPYNISNHKGIAKPSQTTWWIFTLVGGISLISSAVNQTTAIALILPTCYFIGRFTTAIIATKTGVGGWNPVDRTCIAIATLSILLWISTGSASIALIASLCADFSGMIPTLWKSFENPFQENLLGWYFFLLGSIVSIAIADIWSVQSIYQPYILFSNSLMVTTIVIRRGK